MRITTNMVRRNYQRNLSSSMSGLDHARRQVETGMRIAKAKEDPAASAKAAILETRMARNADYENAVKDTLKWQEAQEANLMQIDSMAQQVSKQYSMEAMNDTSADQRDIYASAFREMQKTMVHALNSRYGNAYTMGGSESNKAPFQLSEDGKTLTYRGVDVNKPENADVLEALSRETSYVDLGFGLEFGDDGKIVSSSAFDTAFSGLNAVGFGFNEDGTNKNMISLLGDMADKLEEETFDKDGYSKMWEQFQDSSSQLMGRVTEMGTKTKLLETTEEKLSKEKISIQEQYSNAVGINEAEAILNYSWAQKVYNTALKIGTNVLSPSLLDFIQ